MIIDLRRATEEHYQFALELYLSTMRPYTEELMVWDEAKQRGSFAAQWRLEEVRIITVDGVDVGWIQVAESPTEIRLQQFFISPDQQRAGIGPDVLRKLLATWRAAEKPVALNVLKTIRRDGSMSASDFQSSVRRVSNTR